MGSFHSNAHTRACMQARMRTCARAYTHTCVLTHSHTDTLVCMPKHKNGQVLAATMFATISLTTVLLAEILYIQT